MDLVALTEFLIKSIVKDPDTVSIKGIEDEELLTIEVLVDDDDMGTVIGKGGNIANAIRTIVQTAARANNKKKVKINIDSF
ncbi:MAG: KH domain-containing protein [Mollicutes bacterium]|jgi:predicted RNA-binding protein YlqC (UPF0109 family)|nr:KH domain-containing protein [Mollicutes bacterium]